MKVTEDAGPESMGEIKYDLLSGSVPFEPQPPEMGTYEEWVLAIQDPRIRDDTNEESWFYTAIGADVHGPMGQ